MPSFAHTGFNGDGAQNEGWREFGGEMLTELSEERDECNRLEFENKMFREVLANIHRLTFSFSILIATLGGISYKMHLDAVHRAEANGFQKGANLYRGEDIEILKEESKKNMRQIDRMPSVIFGKDAPENQKWGHTESDNIY